ncbi:hypothetical protein ACVBEQ_02065 [Nakamurella sp. GG22]
MSLIEFALGTPVEDAAQAAQTAAVTEAQRQAWLVVGHSPVPGTSEWEQEQATGVGLERQRAWQLLNMRIQLAAGLDPFEEVLQLRRIGETWATIGRAAGMTRQSAHEKWGQRVLSVLDRYGSGELGGPVADDDPVGVTGER